MKDSGGVFEKIKPMMALIISEATTINRPSMDIQILADACLMVSGLPEEPMYKIPAKRKLKSDQMPATKMEILIMLANNKVRPSTSVVLETGVY